MYFQLISNIFKLLDVLNAWDDSLEGGSEWAEVLQITERILYHSFMIKLDKEVLIEANKRLTRLLQKRVVTDENEATYQMFKLDTVLRISQAHGTLLLYKIITLILKGPKSCDLIICSIFMKMNLSPFKIGEDLNLGPFKNKVTKYNLIDHITGLWLSWYDGVGAVKGTFWDS